MMTFDWAGLDYYYDCMTLLSTLKKIINSGVNFGGGLVRRLVIYYQYMT